MKRYKVRGQVIKVYDLWVDAHNEEAAISRFYTTQTTDLYESGKLIDVWLDHAEIWDEEDDDGE